MKLVLASQSEGRKKLLSLYKIPFKIIPSTLDEDKITASTPLETLILRAKMKGEEVSKKISNFKFQISNFKKIPTTHHPSLTTTNHSPLIYPSVALAQEGHSPLTTNSLVLSADSGAIINDELIGKPKDYADAVRILDILSGQTHQFITAVYCIKIENNKSITILEDHDLSLVTFRKLSPDDIKLYLQFTDYTKYAGGYALFSSPQDFVTKVEGSLSNVVGLPLEKITPILKRYNLLASL